MSSAEKVYTKLVHKGKTTAHLVLKVQLLKSAVLLQAAHKLFDALQAIKLSGGCNMHGAYWQIMETYSMSSIVQRLTASPSVSFPTHRDTKEVLDASMAPSKPAVSGVMPRALAYSSFRTVLDLRAAHICCTSCIIIARS